MSISIPSLRAFSFLFWLLIHALDWLSLLDNFRIKEIYNYYIIWHLLRGPHPAGHPSISLSYASTMPGCRSTPVLSQCWGSEAPCLCSSASSKYGISQGQSRADFFQEAFSNPPVPTDLSGESHLSGEAHSLTSPGKVPHARGHLRWFPHSARYLLAQPAHLGNPSNCHRYRISSEHVFPKNMEFQRQRGLRDEQKQTLQLAPVSGPDCLWGRREARKTELVRHLLPLL